MSARRPSRRAAAKEAAGDAGPLVLVGGALVAMAWVMVVLPGLAVHTIWWGERAVATVEECERRKPIRDTEFLDCRGSWRFADGRRDSGHVSGVGRADVGREVPVRVGPLGPYAGDLSRSRHLLIPGALLWGPTLTVAGIYVFFALRGRARARAMLAQVGGRSFVIGRRRWKDARGRTLLRFRSDDSFFGACAEDPVRRFVARRPFVRAEAGGVAFFIVRRAGEAEVLDPQGRPMVIVRRVGHSPPRLALLAPGGTPLGRIVPQPGSEHVPGLAFRVSTEAGETVAVVVAGFLRYKVVFPGEPAERLRQAVMAFAYDAMRLTR